MLVNSFFTFGNSKYKSEPITLEIKSYLTMLAFNSCLGCTEKVWRSKGVAQHGYQNIVFHVISKKTERPIDSFDQKESENLNEPIFSRKMIH